MNGGTPSAENAGASRRRPFRLSFRTIFVLISVGLTLLFVLMEVWQFYGSTSDYLQSQSETLEDAEFSHLTTLLSEDFAQLETVARLTAGDQQLQSMLMSTTEKSFSVNAEVRETLGYLLGKGRVIQPEIDSIHILTGYGAYFTGKTTPGDSTKDGFLSQFLLENGGWHYPGDPTDGAVALKPAAQKLSKLVFYVLPFSVHSENDSCVCVVASSLFLQSIVPENAPVGIVSSSGAVLLNRTSLSDSALLSGAGQRPLRSSALADGVTLYFETTGTALSGNLWHLRLWMCAAILALCALAFLLAAVFSKPLANPLRSFARRLDDVSGETAREPARQRHAVPIREHILLTLLAAVLSSCLLFSAFSIRFFSSLSTGAFRSSSEDSFEQAVWETENFFTNQHYATLYTAYGGQLQQELSGRNGKGGASDERLSEILDAYRETFLRPTTLSLYDVSGSPLASTGTARFDSTPLTELPVRGQTLWDIRKVSGTWSFVLVSRINDIEELQPIGYLMSQVDEIYLADAYTGLPAGASTAYLCREDGTVISSTDKLSVGRAMPAAAGNELTFSEEIADTPLTLTVVFDDEPLLNEQQSVRTHTLYLLCVILILTVAASLLLSHYISERLYRTFRALATLTPDNMAQVTPETSIVSEIDRMNEAFFEMTQRVQTLHRRSIENERREKELELSRQQARFAMLQAQINPHFLYNSFEAITFMIRRNEKDTAISMLGALSVMLRYAVRTDETLVPVTEEMLYAQTYMEIMQLRYSGLLTASFDLSDEIRKLKIVKFTLQPLLENAINHGFRPRGGQGAIRVTGMAADGKLIITVRDDGVGMDERTLSALQASLEREEGGRHIGLSNIHSRIRALYGDEYGLRVASHPGAGTVVTLLFPILPPDAPQQPDPAG